jgi:hypothetical protein
MYRIKKMDYGYHLTFGGFMKEKEMKQWFEESKKVLADQEGEFVVFVDMRTLKPLPVEAQAAMTNGQRFYRQSGMQRSVVILNNPITTMQFKRIAKESGIYEWERYIDASTETNWEKVGLDWVLREIDPDKK